MNILVFLHGTVIMHKNAEGLAREDIVKQVLEEEDSVRDFENYIPIGKAVEKITNWSKQGAEICYLSALPVPKKVRDDETTLGKEALETDRIILKKYGFPKGEIFHRATGQEYRDVIVKMHPSPDVMIEDDCESIGADEITYNSLGPKTQSKIKSILVKEFGGIDHLPDNLESLKNYISH